MTKIYKTRLYYTVNKLFLRLKGLVIIFLIINPVNIYAHHLRAGDITAELISCQSYAYIFTITGYTDPRIPLEFGYDIVDFGDGTFIDLDTCKEVTKKDLGDNITVKIYKIVHTFPGPGNYTVRYQEPNRNDYVLNMFNSGYVAFYVETQVIIDPFLYCNNTPVLLNPPIDKGIVGAIFKHNPAAWDPDGDSLVYKLVPCKQNRDKEVPGFEMPHIHDRREVNATNAAGTSPATMTMDSLTGDLVWDAPGIEGQYNIAFIVEEWRKINDQWYKLGFVTRDMQIMIEESENNPPELIIPRDTCVEAGTILEVTIQAKDPDGHEVSIESISGIYSDFGSSISLTPNTPVFQPSPASLHFRWETHCNHVREKPYQIIFKAKNNPTEINEQPPLVDYGNWNVTIVAPALTGLTTTLLANNQIGLNWDFYPCRSSEEIQVWRRVDSYNFDYGHCETGIPDYAGYELIGVTSIDDTVFTDNGEEKGLSYGAKYCYRLVAVFSKPRGGESYPSEESCIIIEEDPDDKRFGPVITNVDIEITGEKDGEIFVRWTSPFDLDEQIYTSPYTYELLRSENNFTENNEMVIAGPDYSDTIFNDTGINTLNKVYYYQVNVYDSFGEFITQSSKASSVRLEYTPVLNGIELSWDADVPWSINSVKFPWHYIYRDNVDRNDQDHLILIDSVDVNKAGLHYVDKGQSTNQSLIENKIYCYFIKTLGAYGNPKIQEPLINRSQRTCAYPNDTTPPCIPLRVSFGNITSVNDCEEFIMDKPCDFSEFYNELFWEKNVSGNCDPDNSSFNIYFSQTGEEEYYEKIANIRDTFFIHNQLTSFAGCYRISALDNSGNESDRSEAICNDNCPYFELPNIFTPNDDGYNDTFRAFDKPNAKCPRFVKNVHFRVYNRWGYEVYNSDIKKESEIFNEHSTYIEWDGRDFTGKMLPQGTYYYSAEVEFDVMNPKLSKHIYKGWVHLLK